MSIFRKALPSDQAQIQKIFLDVAHSVSPASMFNWSDIAIQDELSLSSFFVSESDAGIVIAFIAYRETLESAEIIALGTSPRSSRKGEMFALLTYFVQYFSKNRQSIHLEVHSENAKAIALYKKCGFEMTRVRTSYYKDGRDALVMHYKADCL